MRTEPRWAPEDAIALGNIVLHGLPKDDQVRLADEITRGYAIDKASRKGWEETYKRGKDALASSSQPVSKDVDTKSDLRHPVIMNAVIQYAARAKGGIVRGKQVAKARAVGNDPQQQKQQRAERVAAFMSYQLAVKSPSWKAETDRLLPHQAFAGHAFKKITWDDERGVPHAELCKADTVVFNNNITSLEECPRITHEYTLYAYEIEERIRAGKFAQVDLGQLVNENDPHKPIEILECHLRTDLDGDGYAEPWVIVIVKDTHDVLTVEANYRPKDIQRARSGPVRNAETGMVEDGEERIVRIQPRRYFVDYPFIRDPEGGFMGWGYAKILENPQAAINTCLNMIMDAGAASTANGGFIGRGVNFGDDGDGPQRFRRNAWNYVNATGGALRDALVPFPQTQPSPVLFQLVGMMLEAAEKTSGVTDILTGDMQRHLAEGTVHALIEQGLQTFSSVMERTLEAQERELDLIYELNQEHLTDDEYLTVLDAAEQQAPPGLSVQADFESDSADIETISDPRQVTDMQRMARSQAVMALVGHPNLNAEEALRRHLTAIGEENVDALIQATQPDRAAMMQAAAEIELAKAKAAETYMATLERAAKAVERLAEAEAKEAGPQIDLYTQQLAAITPMLRDIGGFLSGGAGQAGPAAARGLPGVVGRPDRPALPPGPGGEGGGMPPGMGGLDGPANGAAGAAPGAGAIADTISAL